MVKVISFSLWGKKPQYNVGAIKNAIIALKFYPDYECWFYVHKETVPKETIEELQKMKNTKIIFKTGDLNKNKPMTWRFEAIDDPNVEIMLSRDTDTRILLREKLAVDEWIQSKKLFHIMRDHPHHIFYILGGMFGTKKIKNIPSWKKLIDEKINQTSSRDYDQIFLKKFIYPIIKKNSLIHYNFHKYPGEVAKNFPIQYCKDYYYVGGYVYEDDSVSQRHTHILINKCLKFNIK